MLIDWFTVVAQAVNFLILVWLMKRYLYQPILKALDAREQRIAAELADADAKKAEAQKERDEFKSKNEEFDLERETLLSKAASDAAAEHSRLLEEARMDADVLRGKMQDKLSNEYRNLHGEISRRAQQEVFSIARKTLTDLAGAGLEERMAGVFVRRLREMDEHTKAELAKAFATSTAPALVRSAFDLPAAQRTAIQQSLNETFSAEIQVRFEIAPEIVGGIELSTNGQKVAWSIAGYLATLENGVEALLKEHDKTRMQAAQPSDLTSRIGKRAYELYEEQGRKEGHAAQDWNAAESEIRKKMLDSGKAKPRHEYKPEAKMKPGPEIKPDNKAEPEPIVKTKPATQDEPKLEVKPEAKAKPEVTAEPKPLVKVVAEPAVADPNAKSDTKPAAKPDVKNHESGT
jgi:F-type H+-transporting ATPase subunit b